MRFGWISGGGAAGGMLLLVAAALLALPNTRVLDDVQEAWSAIGERPQAEGEVSVSVTALGVEQGRVRGLVRNTSGADLGEVTVRVRVQSPSGDQEHRAKVYGLASGAEAWFGIPLLSSDGVSGVELVEAVAVRAGGAQGPDQARSTPPSRLPRRSGVGGGQDVQRFERDLERMDDAIRSISPER